jgi:hypothetical protein
MSERELYYNPEKPSAFSTVNKLSAALPKKEKSDVRALLEHQDKHNAKTGQEEILTQSIQRIKHNGLVGV